MVEHWDGARWSTVPAPASSAPRAYLSDIVRLSGDEFLVSGDQRDGQPWLSYFHRRACD